MTSSTFGLLNSAYSGLQAARAALDVTGQNVANAGTAGYTRQRVDQASVGGIGQSSLFKTGLNIGGGVAVLGVSRLNDDLVDARVRDTASTSGYWDTASSALSTVETSLNEPGSTGLSSTLNKFWNSWQDMGNNPGSDSAATALISTAKTLTTRIAAGYTASAQAWSNARGATASTVQAVNDTAKQIATLNDGIMRTVAAGGNANELMDRRSTAVATLSQLTGATTRPNTNGTVDVIVGGNTVVSGTTTRTLALVGGRDISVAGSSPLHLEFADHPGTTVQVGGGTVAAQLTSLAGPASGGSGGTYAEAAQVYNTLATAMTTAVNAVHQTGKSSTGATNLAFFGSSGTGPAALTMTVVPTSVSGIATGSSTGGARDGSIADAISQIGSGATAPDTAWAGFVSQIGTQSKAAATQATIAASSATAATTAQTSQSGVDLDEESTNLIVFQHAYQGAARVLTAVDQMLDTLINHTGMVGMA